MKTLLRFIPSPTIILFIVVFFIIIYGNYWTITEGKNLDEHPVAQEISIVYNRYLGKHIKSYYNEGIQQCSRGKYREAIESFQKSIKQKKQVSSSYKEISHCWTALGEKNLARNALKKSKLAEIKSKGK